MVHLPILLIHGFNGAPSNWTGTADHFPRTLAEQGYDPELIRVFSYGDAGEPGKRYYNNTGDIREIAHRLDEGNANDPALQPCSVDRLSRDSVARGGPPKITIIAHSSGGLIARYYLSRQSEDRFGTRYRGNVARVIFLGTPHRGVDVEDILDPLPSNLTYGIMIRFHYLFPPDYHEHPNSVPTRLRKVRKGAWRNWKRQDDQAEDMPAFRQLHPRSELLDEINRPGAMPQDIAYDNIVGDIKASVRIQIGKRVLVNKRKDFGDFLVTVKSAGKIPNAFSRCFPINADYELSLAISRRAKHFLRWQHPNQPLPIHRHLRRNPTVQQKILEILAERQPIEVSAERDRIVAAIN